MRQLDSVFAEIDRRLGDVAVRNLGDREAVFLDESVEYEFGKSRRDRIARLVRLGARQRHEFGQRGDAETGRHGDRDLHLGDRRDRREVGLGIEGHVLVHVALHDEDAARPEEQRMVVLCRHDGLQRQQAIAARLAVDDDGLAPFLLQLVGDQPRGGVRSGARTERQHEAHGMRGPLLGEACRRGDRAESPARARRP